MDKEDPLAHRYLRFAHEFLFALNLVLMARLTEGQRDFWPFRYLGIGSWEDKLEFGIESYIYHRSHPSLRFVPKDLPGHASFLLVTLGIALCGVVVLRILSQTLLAKELLRSVAGYASVLALPVSWLYVNQLYPRTPDLPNPPLPWLLIELVIAIASVTLYLFGKWRLPGWSGPTLLILHHIFWGWLFLGGPYFWLASFLSLFPATALCASLAWSLYVSHSTSGRAEQPVLSNELSGGQVR